MSDVVGRFWSKVSKEGPLVPGLASRCWEWTGACDRQGRPRFKLNGSAMYANRALFVMAGRALKSTDHVVTLCQNKQCVRPEHHALGTAMDARALGRGGRIGPGDQYLARDLVSKGEIDLPALAMCFGISEHVAEAIILEGHQR